MNVGNRSRIRGINTEKIKVKSAIKREFTTLKHFEHAYEKLYSRLF